MRGKTEQGTLTSGMKDNYGLDTGQAQPCLCEAQKRQMEKQSLRIVALSIQICYFVITIKIFFGESSFLVFLYNFPLFLQKAGEEVTQTLWC